MAGTEQLGLMFQATPRKIYPVSELVATVRTQLEREFTDVYVEGEISNYRPAESGHLYFTLKDASAQLRVVMWRTQARRLRFRPENGLQVVVRGRITVYDERGDLQLQAEYLEPKGAGALQVAFEQLKTKLAAEGLFDAARKKPIPVLPLRIGLVTSPRGAAVQDILNVLHRRHESVNVLIYPAQVQGETAHSEVSAGIRYFNRQGHVDVIIVARGGGSFEDLFAFNDEGLARIIAGSTIPIISAIGHETDFTICDFVADLRAPTPSAAAELVVRSKHELIDKLLGFHKRLAQFVNYKLLRANNELSSLAQHSVFVRMQDLIARRQQRVDDLTFRLAQAKLRIAQGAVPPHRFAGSAAAASRFAGAYGCNTPRAGNAHCGVERRDLSTHGRATHCSESLVSRLDHSGKCRPAAPARALGAAEQHPAGTFAKGHSRSRLCARV